MHTYIATYTCTCTFVYTPREMAVMTRGMLAPLLPVVSLSVHVCKCCGVVGVGRIVCVRAFVPACMHVCVRACVSEYMYMCVYVHECMTACVHLLHSL